MKWEYYVYVTMNVIWSKKKEYSCNAIFVKCILQDEIECVSVRIFLKNTLCPCMYALYSKTQLPLFLILPDYF